MINLLPEFLILLSGFTLAYFIVWKVYCDIDQKNTLFKKRLSSMKEYGSHIIISSSYSLIKNDRKNRSFNSSQKKGIIGQINLLLNRADINIEFSAFIMGVLGLFFILFCLFLLKFKNLIGVSLISFTLACFIPYRILYYLAEKRKKEFSRQFSEGLDIMVRSIKAGFSVNRAISLVASECKDPLKTEFQLITDKLNAGSHFEQVLLEACNRINLEDFQFFSISLLIQSETGGNLSDTLNNLISLLHKRQEINLKIKALSSEVRASAMIIGSLPFMAALALTFIKPDHMQVFYYTPSGQKWLAIMGILLTLGIISIKRMIQFGI